MRIFLFFANHPGLTLTARWGQRGAGLLLSMLLSVFCTPGAHAQAAPNPEAPPVAGVYKTTGLIFRVWGRNLTSELSRVRLIVPVEGNRILCEQYSSALNIGGRFDLRQLPDGNYAFLVKIGPAEHRFDLHLHTGRVVTISNDRLAASPPLADTGTRAASAAH